MWTRAKLKAHAKSVLKNNYWRALIISLVLLVSGAGYSFSSTSSRSNWNKSSNIKLGYHANRLINEATNAINTVKAKINRAAYMTKDEITTYVYRITNDGGISRSWNYVNASINPIALIIGFGLFVAGIFMIFFRILAGYGLEIGSRRYFINASDNPQTDFHALATAFRGGNYLNSMLTMLLRSLYTFLWTLLFIIPGIIKSLSYSMVPYILADNPKIHSARAIKLSEEMTYGHKWDIFVLNLSFLGWYILGSLCFGIGVVFVFPYENATKAELYLTLRNNALDIGMASCDELCLTPVTNDYVERHASHDYIDLTEDRRN